jgi:hypothetical protein
MCHAERRPTLSACVGYEPNWLLAPGLWAPLDGRPLLQLALGLVCAVAVDLMCRGVRVGISAAPLLPNDLFTRFLVTERVVVAKPLVAPMALHREEVEHSALVTMVSEGMDFLESLGCSACVDHISAQTRARSFRPGCCTHDGPRFDVSLFGCPGVAGVSGRGARWSDVVCTCVVEGTVVRGLPVVTTVNVCVCPRVG